MTRRNAPALLLAALALACASASPRPPAQPSGPAAAVSTQGVSHVSLEEARELQARGARLVDVRTPEEFAAGHLPGAVNLPFDEMESRALAELAPADAPVIVYCHSGKRSQRAAATLEALGFREVHDLGALPEEAAHE